MHTQLEDRLRIGAFEYHRVPPHWTFSVTSTKVRRPPSLVGTLLLRRGDADALLCGIHGPLPIHMPTLDAANIAFNLLKIAAGNGMRIGAILPGVAQPVKILTPTAAVRRIVNATAPAATAAGVTPGSRIMGPFKVAGRRNGIMARTSTAKCAWPHIATGFAKRGELNA